jgi:hypothetical protein
LGVLSPSFLRACWRRRESWRSRAALCGYAASQIGQAVGEAQGLGELGVTTSSGGVGISHYLTQNVYVSASQSASNMQDRKAEIQ